MGELSLAHLIILFGIGFWIYSLAHLLKSNNQEKLIWLVVIVALNFVGVILYWTIGNKKQPKGNA